MLSIPNEKGFERSKPFFVDPLGQLMFFHNLLINKLLYIAFCNDWETIGNLFNYTIYLFNRI